MRIGGTKDVFNNKYTSWIPTYNGYEVYLHITIDKKQMMTNNKLATSELLGKAEVPQLSFKTPDGKSIVIDTDYFGNKRNKNNPSTGPIENLKIGKNRIRVW